MAADEWLWIVQGPDQDRNGCGISPIAQGDCHVAQEAAALGAFHRTVAKVLLEARVVQGHELK
jgi:hypothetical protein